MILIICVTEIKLYLPTDLTAPWSVFPILRKNLRLFRITLLTPLDTCRTALLTPRDTCRTALLAPLETCRTALLTPLETLRTKRLKNNGSFFAKARISFDWSFNIWKQRKVTQINAKKLKIN